MHITPPPLQPGRAPYAQALLWPRERCIPPAVVGSSSKGQAQAQARTPSKSCQIVRAPLSYWCPSPLLTKLLDVSVLQGSLLRLDPVPVGIHCPQAQTGGTARDAPGSNSRWLRRESMGVLQKDWLTQISCSANGRPGEGLWTHQGISISTQGFKVPCVNLPLTSPALASHA